MPKESPLQIGMRIASYPSFRTSGSKGDSVRALLYIPLLLVSSMLPGAAWAGLNDSGVITRARLDSDTSVQDEALVEIACPDGRNIFVSIETIEGFIERGYSQQETFKALCGDSDALDPVSAP